MTSRLCCYPGCGLRAVPGSNRCGVHPKRWARKRAYFDAARLVRASASRCWICGGPFTADDPAVADHVVPRMLGGSDGVENLRGAHRSCNGRRGATLSGA